VGHVRNRRLGFNSKWDMEKFKACPGVSFRSFNAYHNCRARTYEYVLPAPVIGITDDMEDDAAQAALEKLRAIFAKYEVSGNDLLLDFWTLLEQFFGALIGAS
jgi:hypothetical protein